jgi:hypothetical protein
LHNSDFFYKLYQIAYNSGIYATEYKTCKVHFGDIGMKKDLHDDDIPSSEPVKRSVTDINDALIKRVAAMASLGASKNKMQKTIGLTPFILDKVMNMELYKTTLNDISDELVNNAKQLTKNQLAKLSEEAVRVIAANLDKDNLRAAELVLKSMGIDGANEESKGGGFQLVLAVDKPKEQKVVVVEKE